MVSFYFKPELLEEMGLLVCQVPLVHKARKDLQDCLEIKDHLASPERYGKLKEIVFIINTFLDNQRCTARAAW